ncbi:MAG: ATP-dependent DNA helicase, partial [Gemmatimonadota bacterium]
VPVSFAYQAEPLGLEVSGRVDGLVYDGQYLLIEEIKTTYAPLDGRRGDNPVHWAQAKVYGYILATDYDVGAVDVQLTYVHLPTGRAAEDRRTFGAAELEEFFEGLVQKYLEWVGTYYTWCQERTRSIDGLAFPFRRYRPGQRELCDAVRQNIAAGGRLYASAPTGIGKTISVLYAAVQSLGEARAEKLFYLTAKTSGRTVAEKACDDLRAAGLQIKSLTLTARERICFNGGDGRPCDPATCEYALGYFDRINDAILQLFRGSDDFTRARLEATARQHQVCPFELSLDLSLWSDIIICDYNYALDPKAYLRRYFLERSGDYVFLVDEAHNLVDRAREMYSARLRKADVLALRRAVAEEHPSLARALGRANDWFLAQLKRCETEGDGKSWIDRDMPRDLLPLLQVVLDEAEAVLARNRPAPYRRDLLQLFFEIIGFQRVAELFDERYVCYGEKSGRDLALRLFCLDPSYQIRQALRRGSSATFFSATLTPVEYFRDLLGGERGDSTLELDSPFPPENLALLVADDVDTTFRRRALTGDQVAAAIAAAVAARPGRYMAYFPSFQYMEEVLTRLRLARLEYRLLAQGRRMSEADKEAFLAVFDGEGPPEGGETILGFAVMGGIFGEGIDLVGERLIGAIVVGVGLPQLCLERDLIRQYYDERDIPGFEYAYTYPGMNRVLQAAGRVIRSDRDRGLVLLVDRRFGQERYADLFPAAWRYARTVRGATAIAAAAAAFWQGAPPDTRRYVATAD